MPAPIIDGDAIDLRVNEDTYHSGGVLAGLNGSLLTWAVNVAVKGRIHVFGSGQSRPIDAVSHDLGPAETLNLNIGAKPTYVIDMDQLSAGHDACSKEAWVNGAKPSDRLTARHERRNFNFAGRDHMDVNTRVCE